MTLNHASFAAKLDVDLFNRVLRNLGLEMPTSLPVGQRAAAKAWCSTFEEWEDDAAPVLELLERMHALSDTDGEAAVNNIGRMLPEYSAFQSLATAWDRALWLYVNDGNAFRRAEAHRYSRHYAGSTKFWDGLVAPRLPELKVEDAFSTSLRESLTKLFETSGLPSGAIEFDVFEVRQPNGDRVIQLSVYVEDYPTAVSEYSQARRGRRALVQRTRRPALEFALTYIAETGLVEIVGKKILRKTKLKAAHEFARLALRHEGRLAKLPARKVNLEPLRRPCNLPLQSGCVVLQARVASLTFASPSVASGSYTVSLADADQRIWDMIQWDLQLGGDSLMSCRVIQSRIVFRLAPQGRRSGERRITVTLREPGQSDLAKQLGRDRAVIEPLLEEWGLLQPLRRTAAMPRDARGASL